MRTYEHVIDTKAVKATINAIPDYWVVRELTERDYGIDLMIEIFKETGKDRNNHPIYDSTGHVCYLQVKGTNNKVHKNRDNTISFSVERKALLYVEKFPTPFILIRTCTLKGNTGVYFVWLQRYIQDVLDIISPDWRVGKLYNFTIRIPELNHLPENANKIERIASRIKFIEEHAEFYNIYTQIYQDAFKNIIKKRLTNDQFKKLLIDFNRIKQFNTLLSTNACQVSKSDIEFLIDFINDIRIGRKSLRSFNNFTLLRNLNMLLNDNYLRKEIEQLNAENEGDTVY